MPAPVAEEPAPTPAPRIATPQERLRHAFSSDLPENMMSPPASPIVRARPRRCPTSRRRPGRRVRRSCASSASAAAGVNAVNRMIEAEVAGVEFIALNTDAQSLQQSDADRPCRSARDLTRGLGSGSDPELGRNAAMEDYDRIKAHAQGRRHGVHHRRRGRRHRHRRRARRGADRPRARRADRRDRHQAVRLRGLAPRAAPPSTGIEALGRRGRHADRGAEQQAALGARQADVDGRRRSASPTTCCARASRASRT